MQPCGVDLLNELVYTHELGYISKANRPTLVAMVRFKFAVG